MAFDKSEIVTPIIFDDGPNEIFDEKGNVFLALRKVQWAKGENPTKDPEKAKLELRKWIVKDGEEVANKGFSFLTEEGPHVLTHTLIKEGYGKTKEIIKNIKDRVDFRESVEHLYDEESDSEDYFDMRDALLNTIKDDDYE